MIENLRLKKAREPHGRRPALLVMVKKKMVYRLQQVRFLVSGRQLPGTSIT